MPRTDLFGPLQGGERELWRGRCAVAEYAFDKAASLPRWALPETTEVLVTDHRVAYAYASSDDVEVTSGELRWLWPQHLRVQPGERAAGRAASAAQIQLVCAASDGTFPALVFAGGELATPGDADRLANLIRHAIARFRVDNAGRLGLSTPQARMLSRLLIGPEFSNYQGGEGQTVTLLGSLVLTRPDQPAEPDHGSDGDDDRIVAAPAERTRRLRVRRPGLAADDARAIRAAAAEAAAQLAEPGLATRAADLAARVAGLVSGSPAPATPAPAADDTPTTDLTARAANVRRAQARFTANSAKGKAGARPERGIGSRGNRT
ncbi:translation initiation factor 2 [Actinoplanes sp. NPDC026623]|uniref:translation initiation factor 2 n=1 Tax=Actinoplanes sp. NPDC026623 TaxID=3155610 RepID=UPI0033E97E5E